MNRRDFLKVSVSSLVSAFGVMAASPFDKALNADPETAAFGRIYRAASQGRVMVSTNKGKTWHLHTKFQAGYAVQDIFVGTDKRLYVKLGQKKARFFLVMTSNKKAWFAEDFQTQPKPKA